MRFFRLGGSAAPSLDAVKFDTTGYEFQGEPQPGKLRVWYTSDGDGLGLHLFAIPPDLPQRLKSTEELRRFYERLTESASVKMAEVSVLEVGSCLAVRTVMLVPQQPSGLTCLGTLTVPFRDFSFVLKCQCAEGSPTGLKEALLIDRYLAIHEPVVVGEQVQLPGFDPNTPEHDGEFPNAPIARARRVLNRLATSLTVAAEVQNSPRFTLFSKTP